MNVCDEISYLKVEWVAVVWVVLIEHLAAKTAGPMACILVQETGFGTCPCFGQRSACIQEEVVDIH